LSIQASFVIRHSCFVIGILLSFLQNGAITYAGDA